MEKEVPERSEGEGFDFVFIGGIPLGFAASPFAKGGLLIRLGNKTTCTERTGVRCLQNTFLFLNHLHNLHMQKHTIG